MLLTAKLRIYPTTAQADVLWALAERCRLVYNFALQERQKVWQANKTKPQAHRQRLTYRDQQNQLPALKKQFPEYRWVYSKVLQMTLHKLDAAYKSYFALRHKGDQTVHPPRFRGKDYFVALCYNQSGFKVANGILTLSHKHPSKLPLAFQLPREAPATIKQVEITRDYAHRWFACLQYEVEPPAYFDNSFYQAIDLGIENIVSAVNLHGKFTQFRNKRPERYWRPKLAVVQAKRDRCTKGSRQWQWYNAKYWRMCHKLANQLTDWQHYIAKVVVSHTRANTLIIGDPEPKQMASETKRARKKAQCALHYALQSTGSMSRFADLLTYKAKRQGKRVIRVPEAFTSQTCGNCGQQETRPLSERQITCGNCGLQMDRDLNAAINIMVLFLVQKDVFEGLLPEPSVTEESFLKTWKGFLRYARSLGSAVCGPTSTSTRRSANRKTKVPSSPPGRGWDPPQGASPQRTDAPEAPSLKAG
ncbi:MAG: RNA-guided endonuclease InsQ/TnpB family protein [Candidatus Hodarchaeales archaeon]|jgi:putative transposase